jgi:hypothetical protein
MQHMVPTWFTKCDRCGQEVLSKRSEVPLGWGHLPNPPGQKGVDRHYCVRCNELERDVRSARMAPLDKKDAKQ